MHTHIHTNTNTQFNKHRQSCPLPSFSLPHTHTHTLRAISMGIPLPLMLMTPFPFLWRQCSVAVVIWILMADTLHRPAACFQPHSFVYVENHIKVNYYWEVAKSNMWCEERRKKTSSFPFQSRLPLNVIVKLLIMSAFYDVIGTPETSRARLPRGERYGSGQTH